MPSIQKVSKFKNIQAKIALMPPIQNISKTHETNCLHTSNSKNIENSQNKLCQLFKNTFLCQNVSILSNQKPTYIINTKLISWLNLKY